MAQAESHHQVLNTITNLEGISYAELKDIRQRVFRRIGARAIQSVPEGHADQGGDDDDVGGRGGGDGGPGAPSSRQDDGSQPVPSGVHRPPLDRGDPGAGRKRIRVDVTWDDGDSMLPLGYMAPAQLRKIIPNLGDTPSALSMSTIDTSTETTVQADVTLEENTEGEGAGAKEEIGEEGKLEDEVEETEEEESHEGVVRATRRVVLGRHMTGEAVFSLKSIIQRTPPRIGCDSVM